MTKVYSVCQSNFEWILGINGLNIPFAGIEVVWKHIADTFSPWIQTFFIKGGIHVPWIETDKDIGSLMVKALCDVVAYGHHRTAGKISLVLNHCVTIGSGYISTKPFHYTL